MGKSIHPGLLDKAATHCAECVKETEAFNKAAKAWVAAADNIKTKTKAVPGQVDTQTNALKPILQKYAEVVTAIIGLEEQLETAKKDKDKTKQKKLEGDIKKTDKTADTIRKHYKAADAVRIKTMWDARKAIEAFFETPLPEPPTQK